MSPDEGEVTVLTLDPVRATTSRRFSGDERVASPVLPAFNAAARALFE